LPIVSALAESLRFVLVRTTHPGNIGAAARALKTMDQRHLTLVDPKAFPHRDAKARASGACDILEQARVVETVPEALDGATLVYGTTVRRRAEEWPIVTPREAGSRIQEEVASGGQVAFVFGRENGGLLTEELACCHQLIRIPVSADYGTLNLASAVQVITYELMLLEPAKAPPLPRPPEKATVGDLEAYLEHLNDVLETTGFLEGEKAEQARLLLRRFHLRADPSQSELKLLHGILRSIRRKIES